MSCGRELRRATGTSSRRGRSPCAGELQAWALPWAKSPGVDRRERGSRRGREGKQGERHWWDPWKAKVVLWNCAMKLYAERNPFYELVGESFHRNWPQV
jgi:hypothetical protein